jgi:hypothetical protein
MKKVKKSKLTKKEKQAAEEIVQIVSRKKPAERTKAKKGKDKSRPSVSAKEVKSFWKEDLPKVLTTKDLTKLIEEVTDFSLGEDLTAGAKNLRRYLRSMPAYNDDSMTYYRWSLNEEDDFSEVVDIVNHYQKKSRRIG